jgi:hypothetical protein
MNAKTRRPFCHHRTPSVSSSTKVLFGVFQLWKTLPVTIRPCRVARFSTACRTIVDEPRNRFPCSVCQRMRNRSPHNNDVYESRRTSPVTYRTHTTLTHNAGAELRYLL